jgi:fluoroacetyl-CoA thioesterase
MPTHTITPGDAKEAMLVVTPELTAKHIGSGSVAVFATPAMAVLVEQTCLTLAASSIPDGQTTVGVDIHVRHLAPTPVGHTVRIRAEEVDVEGNLITYRAQLWDDVELIGEADHKRAVVDIERFLRRIIDKSSGVE